MDYTNKSIQVIKNGSLSVELPLIEGCKDVFISYGRERIAFVSRLYEELSNHNINVWFDKNELHQDFGSEYTKRIQNGIYNSGCFLIIYTKDVEHSDFIINQELAFAVSMRKKILLYPLEPINIPTSKISHYINRMQWLDFGEENDNILYADQHIFKIRILLQYKLGRLTVAGNYLKIHGCAHNDYYNQDNFKLYVINKSFLLPIPEMFKTDLMNYGFIGNSRAHNLERHLDAIMPDNIDIYHMLIDFLEVHNNIYPLTTIYDQLTCYLNLEPFDCIELVKVDDFDLKEFVNIIAKMAACKLVSELKTGKSIFNGTELGVYKISDNRTTNSEIHLLDMQLYYSDYFTFRCMTEMYHILCAIDGNPFEFTSNIDLNSIAPFLCSLSIGGFLVADASGEKKLMWTRRNTRSFSFDEIWSFSYEGLVNLMMDGETDGKGNLVIRNNGEVRIDTKKLFNRTLAEETGATSNDIKRNQYGIFEVGVIKSDILEVELLSKAFIQLSPKESPMRKIKTMLDSARNYLDVQQMSKIQFLAINDDVLLGKMLSPESHAFYKRMHQDNENIKWHGDEIFISYSRDDSPIVHPFVEMIQNSLETKCWIDMDGIESGEQFEEKIIDAIERAKIVLFMISDVSIKSIWTKREVNYAESQQKRVVPIVLDNKGLRGWFSFHFGNVDYIDVNSQEQVAKLIKNLKEWLK